MPRHIWGIDSSISVTDELYQCITRYFGHPEFWGRYLTRVPNASEGLTKEEIAFLHTKRIKIIPIYNNFRNATGTNQGRTAATNAIFNAKRLGVPKGKILFANIEKFFDVDAEWIKAWVDTIYISGYRSGFYHDPIKGAFSQAYCKAVEENANVKTQAVLWSAEPEAGTTSKKKAPKFKPIHPNCNKDVWVWQYGRNAKECPIDTNLADARILDYLW